MRTKYISRNIDSPKIIADEPTPSSESLASPQERQRAESSRGSISADGAGPRIALH